jgi:hypothetical protein
MLPYRAQVAMELKRAGQFISRTLSYEVRRSRACKRLCVCMT